MNIEIGGASAEPQPSLPSPRHTELPQALPPVPTRFSVPAATPSDEGHFPSDTLVVPALVGNLAMETRRYTDLRRAYARLDLQAKAMARYSCHGDKAAGAKLYAQVLKEPTHPLRLWLQPYLDAMQPLKAAIDEQERAISGLAKALPVTTWANGVRGLSERYLGLIVGECGTPLGEFGTVSCLWKRMGMAVIDGQRQRRVLGDAAIEHGYVARRRALMWNIGNSIIKQQVRNQKDERGKKIAGTEFAIGELGQVYLDRRAYLLARDGPEAKRVHTNAKRYMEKRLLRELWKVWRRAETCSEPREDAPASIQ